MCRRGLPCWVQGPVWLGLQSASQPRLSYAEMAEDYPRYPDIHDLDLTLLNPRMIVVSGAVPWGRGPHRGAGRCSSVRSRLILGRAQLAAGDVLSSLQDVTPYMNPSPFTVSPNTHVSQVFNLFRTMGLRHLPVVNAVGEVSPTSGCAGSLACLLDPVPTACESGVLNQQGFSD